MYSEEIVYLTCLLDLSFLFYSTHVTKTFFYIVHLKSDTMAKIVCIIHIYKSSKKNYTENITFKYVKWKSLPIP